jgi:hypothetical protein
LFEHAPDPRRQRFGNLQHKAAGQFGLEVSEPRECGRIPVFVHQREPGLEDFLARGRIGGVSFSR